MDLKLSPGAVLALAHALDMLGLAEEPDGVVPCDFCGSCFDVESTTMLCRGCRDEFAELEAYHARRGAK